MPELSGSLPDLSRYTEATRRSLYDLLVRIQFTPAEDFQPTMTPDEAGLTIVYLFGRWFAYWRDTPEAGLPEWRLTEMVRIQADPSAPDGIRLYEV